jgi:hypothetical protein
MNEILDSELNSAFIALEREFCGEKLAPYTEGSRLLLMQAKSDEDSSIFFVWAFIFLHIQLAKNRKEAIKIAWNKEGFREKVLDWADTKTPADRDKATNLVGEILEESSKGAVEAIKTGFPSGND